MRLLCFATFVVITSLTHVLRAEAVFESAEQTVTASLGDATATLTFTFKNNGEKPLLIERITTSCGCTTASAGRQIYLAGEVGTVSVSVDIGSAEGKLDKEVVVETESGEVSSKVELKVHVQIPEVVKFEPDRYVRWDQGDAPTAKTIRVNVVVPFPLRIVDVKSWHDKVKATIQEVVPRKQYAITVMPLDTNDVINTAVELLTDARWPGSQKKLWLLVHIKPRGES